MICFIDFETTGVDVFKDFPLEIGAVLVDKDWNVKKEFHSFIRPNKDFKISNSAFQINGIDKDFLANKPTSEEVISNFFSTLGTSYRLAGWNISFDVVFLRKMAHEHNVIEIFNKLNYRHLDVQSISYYYRQLQGIEKTPGSLDDMCEHFQIKRGKIHNALEDAKITLEIFKKILKSTCPSSSF